MMKLPDLKRRRILTASGSVCLAGLIPKLRAAPSFAEFPFSLGVASGYPEPDGMVLWTRLAPQPLVPGGGMAPDIVPMRWEVARDSAFRSIAATGTYHATPDWAHSVHVEPKGLEPDRDYWYPFHAGDATSPIVRTRTAFAAHVLPQRLRMGVGSYQYHVHHATGEGRGYLRLELTPQRLLAELRGLSSVTAPEADCLTTASFVVEDGLAGPLPT